MAASGGEVDIQQFEITSNYNNQTTDIKGGIMELMLWESLFDTTVRANAIYADTGYDNGGRDVANTEGSEDGFVNSAGEKTELVLQDLYGSRLVFTNDYQLRTSKNKRESFGGPNTTKTIVSTEFYSKELIDHENYSNRVVKKYEGKPDDNVRKILTEVLKTPKNIVTDKSKNDYNFLGGLEKVFSKCSWLGRVAVPDNVPAGDGLLAGYLFYETSGNDGGYNFRSIDVLFSQPPVRKYIMTSTNEVPDGYSAKILNHHEHVSIDLQKGLISGDQTKKKLQTIKFHQVKSQNLLVLTHLNLRQYLPHHR